MPFSSEILQLLASFTSRLDLTQRKSLLLLARSQGVPDPDSSPTMYTMVKPILHMLYTPPSIYPTTLNVDGAWLVPLISSPLTAGLVIAFTLGAPYSEDQIAFACRASFEKELRATQTIRVKGEWDWDLILNGSRRPGIRIHELQPHLSNLQYRLFKPLLRFRTRMRNRTLFPHYSRNGVSKDTSKSLIIRSYKHRKEIHGNPRTFHEHLDRGNVTSLDVIHHYIRTGEWVKGRVEMKQRWYPNGLAPRTYFAWGGFEISIAAYLRDFFNDLTDQFSPTDRHNRVQPNWLYDPNLTGSGDGFSFYDLTSFTSWFHEHVPFLESVSRYFDGTPVFLLGENLSLKQYDLGSLILHYIGMCNDFPEFTLSERLSDGLTAMDIFFHNTAGFLGVPGNLATCTLPHGLALASRFESEHQLQIPGDDVGFSYTDDDNRHDTLRIARTVGTLQYSKVFNLPEMSVYLKRGVINLVNSIELKPMLIYPLLPFLVNPSDHIPISPYRLPTRNKLVSRACSVLVSFHRDLWRMTKGELSDTVEGIVLSLLHHIHESVGIPKGAIFQGRVFGSEVGETLSDVVIKFPIDEDDCLRYDPDSVFASRYVEQMSIRMTSDVDLSDNFRSLRRGETIIVPVGKKWKFLEDMGYADVRGIPGAVVNLIGVEAKEAFRSAHKPNLREIRILSDLNEGQLIAMGIIDPELSTLAFYEENRVNRDLRTEQLWRYSSYVDLDRVQSQQRWGEVQEEDTVDIAPVEGYVDGTELDY